MATAPSGQANGAARAIGRALLGLGIVAASLVLAYTLRHHREYQHTPAALATYYGAPVAVLLFLLAALRFRPAVQGRLLLLGLSLALAACGAELILIRLPRLRPAGPSLADLAAKQGVPFDARARADVIRALRAEGFHAYPPLPASYFVRWRPQGLTLDGQTFYPLAGVSRAIIVACNECGEYLRYESDEHGFHNPPGLYDPAGIEVAVLGDSFVQGACVASDENAVSLLRRNHPRTLGFGSPGSGPWVMLALLKEYAGLLRPRAVFWCYFEGNDLLDLLDERGSYFARYADDAFSQRLMDRQELVDRAVSALVEEGLGTGEATLHAEGERAAAEGSAGTVDLVSFMKLTRLRERLGLARGRLMDEAAEEYGRVLELARDRVAAWGGTLYFVYLPSWRSLRDPRQGAAQRAYLLNAAQRLRVPVVDVRAAFLRQPDPLALFPFRQDAHYTAEGYALMAAEMGKSLSP